MPQGASLTRGRSRAQLDYLAGVAAGLIGAAIIAVLAIIAEGLLLLRIAAHTVLGPTAANTTMGLLVGLVVYMGACGLLGALFAVVYTFVVEGDSLPAGITLGALYGLIVWLLVFVALAQNLNRAMMTIPPPLRLGFSLAFGIVLGFYPRLRALRSDTEGKSKA